MAATKVIHTQGSRKRAVARATLTSGSGNVTINGRALENYSSKLLRMRVREPLILAGKTAAKIDLAITTQGGGINGQADAARLAIARALIQHDENLKKTFEEYDRLLLVADVRRKEACKPNDSKARAKRQKSYR